MPKKEMVNINSNLLQDGLAKKQCSNMAILSRQLGRDRNFMRNKLKDGRIPLKDLEKICQWYGLKSENYVIDLGSITVKPARIVELKDDLDPNGEIVDAIKGLTEAVNNLASAYSQQWGWGGQCIVPTSGTGQLSLDLNAVSK